jgi:hypothetical protein
VGNGSSPCDVAGLPNGVLFGVDPLLGPLANNGGLSKTHALLLDQDGSNPAIDAGNPDGCTNHLGNLLTVDQTGFDRHVGGRCDIGAFEWRPGQPSAALLASFDESHRLSFTGSLGGYRTAGGVLDVEGGGPIYWKLEDSGTGQASFVTGLEVSQVTSSTPGFGADQVASVTLVNVDSNGFHQSLLLKVQDNAQGRGDWRRGAIAVFYRATEHKMGIESYVPGRGWHTLATFPMTLRDGDQLGARALADGRVEAYLNGQFVGEASAGSFFAGKGGRIGLWFIVAADALLDDFGGGTVAP